MENKKNPNDPPENNVANVSRTSIKVPPFWRESQETWFAKIEAEFGKTLTTTAVSRFNTVVEAIEDRALIQMADDPIAGKIFEVSNASLTNDKRSDNEVQVPDACASLERQIEALTKVIQSFGVDDASRRRRRSRSTSKHQSRSSTPAESPQKKVNDKCWYHFRFGNDAKKCVKPCNFVSKN